MIPFLKARIEKQDEENEIQALNAQAFGAKFLRKIKAASVQRDRKKVRRKHKRDIVAR